MIRSSKMSRNSQILIVRYSQTKQIVSLFPVFLQLFNYLYLWNQLINSIRVCCKSQLYKCSLSRCTLAKATSDQHHERAVRFATRCCALVSGLLPSRQGPSGWTIQMMYTIRKLKIELDRLRSHFAWSHHIHLLFLFTFVISILCSKLI